MQERLPEKQQIAFWLAEGKCENQNLEYLELSFWNHVVYYTWKADHGRLTQN